MKFLRKNIQKTNRNGVILSNPVSSNTAITTSKGSGSSGSYLPAISNGDGSYTVDVSKVHFNGNILAEGEVTAYKKGTDSETSGGQIVVYDGLDSKDPNIALSANQGRILKELVDTKGSGTGNLENYYTRQETDKKIADLVNGAPETMDTLKELSDALQTNKDAVDAINKSITNKADKDHKHTKADITDLDLTKYDNHLSDTSKHITEAERTKWNGKLDKSVWDQAFYFNNGDLRVKLNLIGDKEVSAYGKGETGSGSGGVITIADNLITDAPDVALSARQGVILKNLIDSKEVNIDLSDYYTKSQIDTNFQPKGNYLTTIPSEYITEAELNAKKLASTGWVNTNFQPKGNYLTSHQSITHLANKDGSNASGTWGISITGNAATATNSDKLKSDDTRSVIDKPLDINSGFYADFKYNSTNGLNDGGSFNGVLTFRPYGNGDDFSGGYTHQIGFTENGNIYHRKAYDKNTWQDWVQMATVNSNVASANGLKEGNNVWTANYSPTNVKNPTWLCGWNASNHTLEAVDRASLSVSYATTAGSTKTITDGTYGMYLADNGYLLRKGNTYLGSSSDRWEYIYCKNLDASGNIRAAGDIIAYAVGDGDTSTNKGIVYDGLDSSDGTIALSANQGRLLNNKITEIDGKFQPKGQFKTINNQSILGNGNINISAPSVDTSKFYNKNEGIVLNTRTIYGSASLSVNDDFIIVNNSSWANITLPSSAPVGKIIHFKQLTGTGLQFVGGVYDSTGNSANWNFQLKKYAHSFYLIHTGGNKWAFFGGW